MATPTTPATATPAIAPLDNPVLDVVSPDVAAAEGENEAEGFDVGVVPLLSVGEVPTAVLIVNS